MIRASEVLFEDLRQFQGMLTKREPIRSRPESAVSSRGVDKPLGSSSLIVVLITAVVVRWRFWALDNLGLFFRWTVVLAAVFLRKTSDRKNHRQHCGHQKC